MQSIRKHVKYNSSIGASNSREIEHLRDLGETGQEHDQKMMIQQDKLVASQMLDRVCLDYYLPFQTDEDIKTFLRKDPDLHRRKVALREVRIIIISLSKLIFTKQVINTETATYYKTKSTFCCFNN